jgi:hypothetical protein
MDGQTGLLVSLSGGQIPYISNDWKSIIMDKIVLNKFKRTKKYAPKREGIFFPA